MNSTQLLCSPRNLLILKLGVSKNKIYTWTNRILQLILMKAKMTTSRFKKYKKNMTKRDRNTRNQTNSKILKFRKMIKMNMKIVC